MVFNVTKFNYVTKLNIFIIIQFKIQIKSVWIKLICKYFSVILAIILTIVFIQIIFFTFNKFAYDSYMNAV